MRRSLAEEEEEQQQHTDMAASENGSVADREGWLVLGGRQGGGTRFEGGRGDGEGGGSVGGGDAESPLQLLFDSRTGRLQAARLLSHTENGEVRKRIYCT